MTLRPDPDALDRACANLSLHHGDIEVSVPNAGTGSVTLFCADGDEFRFTTQGRVIHPPARERLRSPAAYEPERTAACQSN